MDKRYLECYHCNEFTQVFGSHLTGEYECPECHNKIQFAGEIIQKRICKRIYDQQTLAKYIQSRNFECFWKQFNHGWNNCENKGDKVSTSEQYYDIGWWACIMYNAGLIKG